MCTVFVSLVSLRCLPSTVLSAVNTRGQKEGIVCGGKEKGRVMHAALFIGSHPCPCFVLISL